MDEGAGGDDLQHFVGFTADRVGGKVPVVDHPRRDDGCVFVVAVPTEICAIIVAQPSHTALRF